MFEHLGIAPADILLPNCNLSKWSVIACDQFTSQTDYWNRVDRIVGTAPSALRLVLPEAYLRGRDIGRSVDSIQSTMQSYLDQHLFYTCKNAMVYVERYVSGGAIRKGLVCQVDLEEYEYRPGSQSLIRATENTVEDRIPPRVRIREGAPLELPHVMILMDDSRKALLEPLAEKKDHMEKLYGFSLMEDGGRIDGWRLDEETTAALEADLRLLREHTDMLFAVGDGNHSLAAAKAIYERDKEHTPKSEWAALPSRWALAEIVSLNDAGVEFLPIHRMVFGVNAEHLLEEFRAYYPETLSEEGAGHVFRYCSKDYSGTLTVPQPEQQLAVETLQNFLDDYVAKYGGKIDYIHDMNAVQEICRQTRCIGFLLPEFPREALFPFVKTRGALPRKTFSIGHSRDKRYYLEARLLRGE